MPSSLYEKCVAKIILIHKCWTGSYLDIGKEQQGNGKNVVRKYDEISTEINLRKQKVRIWAGFTDSIEAANFLVRYATISLKKASP
jgi:hypothetical protein